CFVLSSRRRHTRSKRDWSSDVCSSDLIRQLKKINQTPDVVAGHSLGIFAAAVASGVISEDDAIKIVYIRSQKMQESYPTGYGMRSEERRVGEECRGRAGRGDWHRGEEA